MTNAAQTNSQTPSAPPLGSARRPHPPVPTPAGDLLTPDEKRALELRYDGRIPQQAIIDTLCARHEATRGEIVAAIEEASQRAIQHFTERDRLKIAEPNNAWMIGYENNRGHVALREADELNRRLAAMLEPST